MDKRICVLGLGYIGLPTASFLATKGYEVLGVDVAAHVVETINRAEIHIVEPDLDMLVKSSVQSGRLRASLEPEPADIFIIAVPTPLDQDKSADLSMIAAARGAVGKLHIAHCPERVLPMRILTKLIQNDRIIGRMDTFATEIARFWYGIRQEAQYSLHRNFRLPVTWLDYCGVFYPAFTSLRRHIDRQLGYHVHHPVVEQSLHKRMLIIGQEALLVRGYNPL